MTFPAGRPSCMFIKWLSTHIFAKVIWAWSILKQNTLSVLMWHHLQVTLCGFNIIFFHYPVHGLCCSEDSSFKKCLSRCYGPAQCNSPSHKYLLTWSLTQLLCEGSFLAIPKLCRRVLTRAGQGWLEPLRLMRVESYSSRFGLIKLLKS